MINSEMEEPVQHIARKSLEECKSELYKLFGYDYTIVNKRQILHGGFLGFGQKEWVEVTYRPIAHTSSDTMPSSAAVPVSRASKDDLEAFRKNKEEILKTTAVTSQLATVTNKMDEMQAVITKQLQSISTASAPKHPTIQKIEDLLSENEFSFSYITMISDKIRAAFSLQQLEDFKTVERNVVDWIGQTITIAPSSAFRPPHVIIIVGPTGVGKTTTIAKLAAKHVLDAKNAGQPLPALCIITIDKMRAGAYEQLSTFGNVLNTDVKKAENAKEVKEIYEDNKDSVDSIFIDTSGYSPNDSIHIGEMKSILTVDGLNPDIYLSVCASTKSSDLKNIMQNYEPFAYKSVIVTKCDETEKYGNIISSLYEQHKSVSYLCDGQNVARNIKRANTVDFLIRLSGFTVDRVHIEDEFGEK
jgi:flagellar biosynthesis protein FlhF